MCGRLSQYSGIHDFVAVLSMPNALANSVGEARLERYNVAPQASQVEVGGYKAWIITFTSKALDTDILNMQLYMLSDNNLIVATFNMTKNNVNEYQSLAKKTLISIKPNG